MDKLVISSDELTKLADITNPDFSEYEHLKRPGVCGMFLNDKCLYVFSGSNIISRIHLEMTNFKLQREHRKK
jgi:hypothetical protein